MSEAFHCNKDINISHSPERITNNVCNEQWLFPSLSVPSKGRTLSSVTKPLATILRKAVSLIESNLDGKALDRYKLRFTPRDERLGSNFISNCQISWTIVAMWCIARLVYFSKESITLSKAEAWFFRDTISDDLLSESIKKDVRNDIEKLLMQLDVEYLRDLLPYALDHHGPGTRRDALHNALNRASQESKQRTGVYYTPSDVADYMTSWILTNSSGGNIIDPACGTGVYLLSAARQMIKNGIDLDMLIDRLYGIDVDPIAVDLTCFVLTAFTCGIQNSLVPARIWHRFRMNTLVFDTISLLLNNSKMVLDDASIIKSMRDELREILTRTNEQLPVPKSYTPSFLGENIKYFFPETNGAFDGIVTNPPYAKLGLRKDLRQLSRGLLSLNNVNVTPNTNMYIPFMEAMWLFGNNKSRSAMIVPLSISYNSAFPFRSLRNSLCSVGGAWYFRFFDRTPDAIFGDDIKQRVAIVLNENKVDNTFEMHTSTLHRWTSTNRNILFSVLPTTTKLSIHTERLIPKIGQQWEKDTYEALISSKNRLSVSVKLNDNFIHNNNSSVYVGTTAYNWLVLYRNLDEKAEPTSNIRLEVESAIAADWLYAVLASRLTYWLWRVEGDGFHVPLSFIESLPFSWNKHDENHLQLASAGKALWISARQNPIESINNGRRTRSYSTHGLRELDVIDILLLKSLSLEPALHNVIKAYVTNTITVGRDQEYRRKGKNDKPETSY